MDREKLFPFFTFNPDTIYLDNAATSLPLQAVINTMNLYYTRNPYNINRSGYIQAMAINYRKNIIADKIARLLSANKMEDIIFTSGATEGLNMLVFGYFSHVVKPKDEILLTYTEHASNALPWFKLAHMMDLTVRFIPLDKDGQIDLAELQEMITEKTRVISIASVTNTNGDLRDLSGIGNLCEQKGISFIVDHAQGAAHYKVNVRDCKIDFLVFSGHKIYGPKGIGVLYCRPPLADIMKPLKFGGGMNLTFDATADFTIEEDNNKFYAGTENISAILGLEPAIDFLNNHLDHLNLIETRLSEYLRKRMEKINGIKILNKAVNSPITLFTIDGILSMDLVDLLAAEKILIRGGHHCAKMTKELYGVTDTCRVSLAFYNTTEEIDKFCERLEEICKKYVQEVTVPSKNVEQKTVL